MREISFVRLMPMRAGASCDTTTARRGPKSVGAIDFCRSLAEAIDTVAGQGTTERTTNNRWLSGGLSASSSESHHAIELTAVTFMVNPACAES